MRGLGFEHVRIPPDWTMICGADTGAYMSALFVAISPDPYEAMVLAEYPNYRYVGGEIELLGYPLAEWSWMVREAWKTIQPDRRLHAWCDWNSQFVSELSHQGIALHRNAKKAELRTEISREYFQHDKIRLAPWLDVLPYELENAKWPEDVNASGDYKRVKESDHTLDCLEHALSRRPRSKRLRETKQKTFIESFLERHRRPGVARHDVHLGRL